MPYALLSILQPGHAERELEIADDVVSIGRAPDNTICLEGDTNVSRNHAEIEKRDDAFFLLDLGSSNGTTVNDLPVEFERRLRHGDVISIGNSTVIDFRQSEVPFRHQSNEPAAPVESPSAASDISVAAVSGVGSPVNVVPNAVAAVRPTLPAASGPPVLLIVGGVAGGLILTALVALLIIGIMSRNSCAANIHIASPESGATLRGPTPIRLEVEGAKCIEKVIYQIDGVKVASVETSPYDIVLDPAQLRNVGEGNHTLSVSIEDSDGKVKLEETLLFAVAENIATGPTPNGVDEQPTTGETPPVLVQDANVDVRSLSDRLAGQISRKSGYVFDRDFVELIRTRTGEYRAIGYTDKARRYRREINKAFRDQGLDPLLGYILAMSRSKFNDNARGEGIGLWQIPVAVAQAGGYLGSGESEETLKDPKRSAEIAAVYTKALVSTFESTDDFMFAVACFGLPLSQAGQLRTQLATQAPDPIARRDFMKMIKLGVVKGDQVDRVVRFFAAGIVTENPQAFGLQTDAPFSSLF
jgi:FHA domain/Bacterial Ig domain/Transglycosylase SLT domain